jgi:hypothetical protein
VSEKLYEGCPENNAPFFFCPVTGIGTSNFKWYTFEVPSIYVQGCKDDNARPHTSLKTLEAITKFSWTVLPNPPYSPDVASSDFHLFGALKMVSVV